MSARLTIRDDGAILIIEAYGRLASGEGRHSLHAQLRKLTERGLFRVLLNLSGVPSLDSADIGELMAGYSAFAMAGGELRLLDPRGRFEEVLRTTGLSRTLDTYPDEASAIRSFSGRRPPRHRMAATPETRSEWYYG